MIRAQQFASLVSAPAVRSHLRSKSVRGALFAAAGGGLDLVVRLASTLILARLLVPGHFGLIGVVTALTGMAEQFSSLGLSTATVQAPEITHRQCSNLFWTNVVAGLAFGALICGAAPLVAAFYHDDRLIAITMAIALNFVWGGLTVQHDALLNRQMRQSEIAGNRLVANTASAVLAVVLAVEGCGFWALVWREVSRSFLVAVGVWRLFPWIPSGPSRGAGTSTLLRFGRDMSLVQILILPIMRLDSILIGRFAGFVSLGLYRQAQNLLLPLEQVTTPIQFVALPGLSSLQAEPDRYRRYWERVVLLVGVVSMPFGIFCALYAKEIVLVVLGPKWAGAAVFMQIAGVGATIRPVLSTTGIVLITRGRQKMLLKLTILQGVTLTVLMTIGIPWGAVGIALGQISATLLLMIPNLYFSLSGSPVSMQTFFRALAHPLIATVVMGIVLVSIRIMVPVKVMLVSLFLGSVTGTATFTLAFLLLPGGAERIIVLVNDVRSSLRQRGQRAESDCHTA